jgi:hypothetical protein
MIRLQDPLAHEGTTLPADWQMSDLRFPVLVVYRSHRYPATVTVCETMLDLWSLSCEAYEGYCAMQTSEQVAPDELAERDLVRFIARGAHEVNIIPACDVNSREVANAILGEHNWPSRRTMESALEVAGVEL